jgi:hypothetical protein
MSTFYYPVSELESATTEDGQYSVNTFDPDLGSITNHDRLIDGTIGSSITGFGANEVIRVDLGSSVACDFVAVYFSGAESDDLTLYASDTTTDMSTSIESMTASFVTGWNVFTFSSTTKRYWFLRASGTISNLTEMIIGSKYTFDVNFDINNKVSEEFGTDIVTSYGGQEYANKRHEPKTTWNWNWSFVTASMKTSLESFQSVVSDHQKFIYYDDTNYHYVRMLKPLDFTEIAYNVYSTNVSLREQLT